MIITWRFLGSYKLSYKSPNMDFRVAALRLWFRV